MKVISDFLHRPDVDARKLALLCLTLVGTAETIPEICTQLTDNEPAVNQMAEHALWSIWFRGGSPEANAHLCRGAKQLSCKDFDAAVSHFDRAIELSPNFAEPYNQRAIARFMQDQYELSIGDCRRTIRLMPCHFGALAGMGHCFLHLGLLDHALRAYDRAIAINPHMQQVVEAAAEIRKQRGV